MVIVHVVEPFASGVAVFVKLLTEAMPEDQHIIVHGERLSVKPANEVKREFTTPNVRFIRWKSACRSIHPVKDLKALGELYTILKRLKERDLVDAVHLHSSKSGFLGRAAARLAGIPTVLYTPNGAPFLSAKSRISRLLFKTIERAAGLLGGKVVCCSPSEYEAYRQLGIAASYINNGIQLSGFQIEKPVKTNRLFTIVTSGRIDDQKNPELFNSIAKQFADMKDVRFVWIGDGAQRSLLTSSNITITGWKESEEVKSLVGNANVYLSTSRYEGLSFAVMEALAQHKPVLLTNCTGNSDMVRQGMNGDLFADGQEAVIRLLHYYNNPEMLQVMGQYSAAICDADYDMEINFRKYRNLYMGSREPNLLPARKWSFS